MVDYSEARAKIKKIKNRYQYNPKIKDSLTGNYLGGENKEALEAYLNKTLINIEDNLSNLDNASLVKLENYYYVFEGLSKKGKEKGVNIDKYLEALKRREDRIINTGLKSLDKKYSSQREEIMNNILNYIEKKSPTNKIRENKSGLEKSLVVLSIGSLLASLLFVSNNLTGNVVLSSEPKTSMIFGAGLFVLGLVSFLFAKKF